MRYEYAGFMYEITVEGLDLKIWPVPGQHPAASKERHLRAALDMYREELNTKGAKK